MGWLLTWWVWIGIAMLLGIVEILAPGFIFLGFSLAALALGGGLLIVPGLFDGLGFSALMALFAALALLAWLILRLAFRRQSSGARIFTKDIND